MVRHQQVVCGSAFVQQLCDLLDAGEPQARKDAFKAFDLARNGLFVRRNGIWHGREDMFKSFPVPVIPGDVWSAVTADNLTKEQVRQLCSDVMTPKPFALKKEGALPASERVVRDQAQLQREINTANVQAGFADLKGTGAFFPSPYAQEFNRETGEMETVTPHTFRLQHPNLTYGKDWVTKRVRGRDVVVILNMDDRQCPPFMAGVMVDLPVMRMIDGRLTLTYDAVETVSSSRVKKQLMRRPDGTTYFTCVPNARPKSLPFNTWISSVGAQSAATTMGFAPLSQDNFDALPEQELEYNLFRYGAEHRVPYKLVEDDGRTIVAVLESNVGLGLLPPLSVASEQ